MIKRGVLIVLSILVLVYFVSAQCSDPQGGYDAPCGHGEADCHGIQVGELCYDCGADDEICPEDYNVTCDCDNDCEGKECEAVTCPDPGNCGSCGDGIANNCDEVECNSCGDCYFIDGVFLNDCLDCATEVSCGDITEADCGIACSSDLSCEWDGSNCVEIPELLDCDTVLVCGDYTTRGDCDDNVCELTTPCIYVDTCEEAAATCEDPTPYECDLDGEIVCTEDAETCDTLSGPVEGECDYSGCDDICAGGAAECLPDGCDVAIDCDSISSPTISKLQAFPIYDNFNLILTVLILFGFYLFRKKK